MMLSFIMNCDYAAVITMNANTTQNHLYRECRTIVWKVAQAHETNSEYEYENILKIFFSEYAVLTNHSCVSLMM